ncbi:MAG TPA: hypothetical protein VFN26_13290 [Candidatus Acidoferrum sp.]|nr:hypothetical protein [Candidatus Acidoferrum sp.]
MPFIAISVLFALQCFHVLFLGLHDWIPLGSLNDVKAVRAATSLGKLLLGMLISLLPFAFGLVASAYYLGRPYPHWLLWYLGVSYVLLFIGELEAWWIPYLFRPDPARAARYQAMFGNTHAFLPARNGITPNTLHVTLHLATLVTLLVLSTLIIS